MKYDEAKNKFIQSWGQLGASWGINRTMSQINALLMISTRSLSTDEIMEELNISRGNANMNLRELIAWGIVFKEFKPGERKEYFYSEKDVYAMAKQISRERSKRELEPIIRTLEQLKSVEGDTEEVKEFKKMTSRIEKLAKRVDGVLSTFFKLEENVFFKWFKPK